MKERVLEEMKRAFRPEFLNRIDDIIVFHALSLEHIKEIIRLMIGRINKQLAEKGIQLLLTPAAEAALVEKGYDQTYGARQLRRTIQKHIEDPWPKQLCGARSRRALASRWTSMGRPSSSAKRRPSTRLSSLLNTSTPSRRA
jgi:ATP-dependent Clp protease ATP-binding subunit ClpA